MSSAPTERVSTLVVRPKRAADEPFIASLSAAAFGPYSHQAAGSVSRMMKASGSRTLVATLDEVPVAMAVMELRRTRGPFGPFDDPAVAHLDAIAVLPARQGEGIGGCLLEAALELAESEGAVAMTLMTAARNQRARYLFEAKGFVVLAALDDVYAERERALMMHKALLG
jgi:ribosomal protein S18 acetylase RimI-like enzyme